MTKQDLKDLPKLIAGYGLLLASPWLVQQAIVLAWFSLGGR